MRAAATTAVVAGTASPVHHHQEKKYANQAAQQQAECEQQLAAQAPAEPQVVYCPDPAPGRSGLDRDRHGAAQQLGDLHAAGVLTDEGSRPRRPAPG